MSNNGTSYQRYDGASGTYQEIPNGASEYSTRSKKTKWLIGAAILVAVGVVYSAVTMHNNSDEKAVDKALANTGTVEVKANGKLKLFDSLSKLLSSASGQERSFLAIDSLQIQRD